MINNAYRRLMLDHPEIVRAAVLTPNELKAAQLVRGSCFQDPTYCRTVADHFDWSIQQASVVMARLIRAGYVERRKGICPTGGIEYRYWSVIDD